MNLITHRFSLDLAKHGSQVVLNGFKTGDTNRAIDVSLAMNGIPYYLGAEHSAQIRMKIYTEEGPISIHDPCTIKDERVFYKINPAALSVAGTVTADIEIGTAGADIFSTARFVLFVTAGEGDDTQIPEEQYNSVITALANSELALKKTISTAAVNYAGNLVITFEDNTAIDVGKVVGPQGDKGEKGDKGAPDYSLVANALKGKAGGSAVSMTDVSPLEHNIGVKLASKNILPYPYYETSKEGYGVKWTDNGDGTITGVGTPTVAYGAAFVLSKDETIFKPGFTYTLSVGSDLDCYIQYDDEDGSEHYVKTVTWKDGYHLDGIYLNAPKIQEYNGIAYPQLEIGETATAYTPFADVSSVTLTKCGKNLLSYPYERSSATVAGITYTDNGDGTLTAKGTPSYQFGATFMLTKTCPFKSGVTYTFSEATLRAQGFRFSLCYFDKEQNKEMYPDKLYTITWDDSKYQFRHLAIDNGSSLAHVDNVLLCPQIEIGTVETEYEPYKEPETYSGTVESVTSLYPTTTLMTDTAGVTIAAEYNRDINKAFAELLAKIGG